MRYLLATKNETGDVVELARRADESIHLLHQELHGLLRCLAFERIHAGNKAQVTELFAFLIERVHHSVREKKKQISRSEIGGADIVLGTGFDTEGNAAGFEAFNRAVFPTQDRIVMTGVYVFETASAGVILREKRGGEAASIETVSGRVAVEARYKLRKGNTLAGDGTEARLERGHEKRGRDALSSDVCNDQE